MSKQLSNSAFNNYFFKCEKVDMLQSYRVCLTMVAMAEDGKADRAFKNCREHLSCGDCPAQAMNKEEIKKGEKIYFKLYTPPGKETVDKSLQANSSKIDKSSISYRRGRNGFTATDAKSQRELKEAKQAKEIQKKAEINVEIKVEKKTVKKTQTRANTGSSIKPLPGEKPAEFAKRLRQSRGD